MVFPLHFFFLFQTKILGDTCPVMTVLFFNTAGKYQDCHCNALVIRVYNAPYYLLEFSTSLVGLNPYS